MRRDLKGGKGAKGREEEEEERGDASSVVTNQGQGRS